MTLQNIFFAPFSGSRTVLGGENTICEYNGTVDASGNLLDVKRTNKYVTYHLTPSGTPTTAISTIQTNDGNLWQGRTFNGTTNVYSIPYQASFGLGSGNWTVTVVYSYTSTAADTTLFTMSKYGSIGFELYRGAGNSNLYCYVYGAGGTNILKSVPADGYAHTIQVVKRDGLLFMVVDGVRGTPKTCTASITDITANAKLAIGAVWHTAAYWAALFAGNVYYVRWDAEALSDEQLETERNMLMGFASSNPSNVTPTYTTRSTANYKTINGKLYSTLANIPRIGSDGLLIEEARTNLCGHSCAYESNWTNNKADFPVTNSIAPDNSATARIMREKSDAGDPTVHGMYYPIITQSKTTITLSCYVKPINRTFVKLYDGNSVDGYIFCDLAKGIISSYGASSAARGVEALDNGWYRCWTAYPMAIANIQPVLYLGEADGDINFNGLNQQSIYVWGYQVEVGSHVTSYIPTITVAVERKADDYTIRPWNLNTALTLGTETWFTTFDQDVASAGTVSLGGKTFTQVGDTKHLRTSDLKHYYDFDGTGDYLTIADSSFNPAGSFSLVAVVTPSVLTADTLFVVASKLGAAGDAAWYLYFYGPKIVFEFSKTGSAPTYYKDSVASSFTVGKTSLVTVTYAYSGHPDLTDSRIDVYVDGLAVASKTDCAGPIFASTANFAIGAKASGTNAYNGKLHYFARHDGTVLTKAQHDALYARFKTDGVLPLTISATSHYKKINISLDAKCLWSNLTSMGTVASSILEIGGYTGSADLTHHRLILQFSADGYFYASWYNSLGNNYGKRSNSTNPVDFSKWHHYEFYFDTANLANTYLKVDGSTTGFTSDSSGALIGAMPGSLILSNTLIRLGQRAGSQINGNCNIKNLNIQVGD